MKTLLISFFLVSLTACSVQKKTPKNIFNKTRGCFLLYNLKTNTYEQKMGDACEERFPACSTFKVPLAIMAFDSGLLKDERQVLKWDGKKRMLDAWNKDHDAQSWMRESVVWYSQRLTPELGAKKVNKYLKKFSYGNQDMSSGLTSAWLNSPRDASKLAINAYEQVEFMKKLWNDTLDVSKRSMELTRKITFLETSPNGFELSGKTGSNFYDAERKIQFGWFISHLKKGDQEYIAVTNLSDLGPVETDKYGGHRAKELTKTALEDLGLW